MFVIEKTPNLTIPVWLVYTEVDQLHIRLSETHSFVTECISQALLTRDQFLCSTRRQLVKKVALTHSTENVAVIVDVYVRTFCERTSCTNRVTDKWKRKVQVLPDFRMSVVFRSTSGHCWSNRLLKLRNFRSVQNFWSKKKGEKEHYIFHSLFGTLLFSVLLPGFKLV